jgi:hypothetical protein
MGADKVVGWVCIFVAGWLVGTWVTPEPKFAACVEIPRKPVSYPATKREMQQFIKAYHSQGEGAVR